MNLIKILQENRLMKTPQEINLFEETLEKLAKYPDDKHLKDLHLILDDNCEHPEIMFSLLHFLEDFETQQQIQAFIEVIPHLMITAPDAAAAAPLGVASGLLDSVNWKFC